MYYRLLSPLILPKELDRVLYLDPDILIINSLRPLWELNLDMKVFAAASHTGLTEITNDINQVRLDTEHEYFNSGVMLIDLNAARKLVTSQDVFDCVCKREKDLILPDQDVFNILYGKETMPVDDVIWNAVSSLFESDDEKIEGKICRHKLKQRLASFLLPILIFSKTNDHLRTQQ